MKFQYIALVCLTGIFIVSCNNPKSENTATEKKEVETSLKGNRAPSETMTGVVWLLPFATDSVAHWSSAKVTFEKGAHSNWHTHAG
jgi:quercetin dioxygenase-like cupin family protein